MSTLDRIKKLVVLASSANENEARNAAVQACKLITEHKVVLTMPGQASSGEVPFRNVRTGVNPTKSAEEVMRDGEPVDLRSVLDGLFGKDAVNRVDRIRRETREESPPAYTMDAPQEGTCRDCGEGFRRGDRIWYRRGVGAVHAMRCDPIILNQKA